MARRSHRPTLPKKVTHPRTPLSTIFPLFQPVNHPPYGRTSFARKPPLPEEVPVRAEESLVPLEKGDARQGRGIV